MKHGKMNLISILAFTDHPYFEVKNQEFVQLVTSDVAYYLKTATIERVLIFPPVTNYYRLVIHKTVEESFVDLCSFSVGERDDRRTVVCLKESVLRAILQPQIHSTDVIPEAIANVRRSVAMSQDRWDHGSWDEISKSEKSVHRIHGRGRGRGRKREDNNENPPGCGDSYTNRCRSNMYSDRYESRYESKMYCDRYEPEGTSKSSSTFRSCGSEKERSKIDKPEMHIYVQRSRRSRESENTKSNDSQEVQSNEHHSGRIISCDSSKNSSKTRKPRAPIEVYVPRAKRQQNDIDIRRKDKVSDKPSITSGTWEEEEKLYNSGLISVINRQESEESIKECKGMDKQSPHKHNTPKDNIYKNDSKRHNSKERNCIKSNDNIENEINRHTHKRHKSKEGKVKYMISKPIEDEASKYSSTATEKEYQNINTELTSMTNQLIENVGVHGQSVPDSKLENLQDSYHSGSLPTNYTCRETVQLVSYDNKPDCLESNFQHSEKQLVNKGMQLSELKQSIECDERLEQDKKEHDSISRGKFETEEDTFFECNSDLDVYSNVDETIEQVDKEPNKDLAINTLDTAKQHQSDKLNNEKCSILVECQYDIKENTLADVNSSKLCDEQCTTKLHSDSMDTEEVQEVDLKVHGSEVTCGALKKSEEMTIEKEDSDHGDTWDALFDDDGEAIDPKILDELTVAVGKVKVTKTQFDYYNYQPKDPDMDYEAYNHLIEIYDFPKELETRDLVMAFVEFKDKGFEIKWVDDTHAIGVFSSVVAANSALCLVHPLMKVRPLSQASRQTKMKAKKSCEFLQPYKPRPETVASVARNLVAGALGLQTNVPKEKREEERRKLKEAREQKKAARKQKQAAWDGSYGGKCAMDDY